MPSPQIPAPPAAAVTLRDGRRLAFETVGRPGAAAVVYLHGLLGSSLAREPGVASACAALDVQLICVHRPGFAASGPPRRCTPAAFAHDIGEVLVARGLERVGLLGVSAGGPYALACAHHLGGRAAGVALVASLAPLTRRRDALGLLRGLPGACGRGGDRRWRRGPVCVPPWRGMAADLWACTGPWGFAPQEVAAPVDLWHGMHDPFVPLDHALALAVALPDCRVALDPDEGHFFLRRRLEEVLGGLLARATLSGRRPVDAPLRA